MDFETLSQNGFKASSGRINNPINSGARQAAQDGLDSGVIVDFWKRHIRHRHTEKITQRLPAVIGREHPQPIHR